jgi:hypothetical protein
MTEMPDFDVPLLRFVNRLRDAEFSQEEIDEAAGALGGFTGDAFAIIQRHIHGMVDRLGLAITDAFPSEVINEAWYKGLLAGIVVSLQVVLHGDDHAKHLINSGVIEQMRQGMDALLGQDETKLPPELFALIQVIRSGEKPTEEVVRAATQAWNNL